MFLNKKGWHTFMSICLCVAVLNKQTQSTSLGDHGKGQQQRESMGLRFSFLLGREAPSHTRLPSEVLRQTDTFVFAITTLSFHPFS